MPPLPTWKQMLAILAIWCGITVVKLVLQRTTALDPAMLERADGFFSAVAIWLVCLRSPAQGIEAAKAGETA